MKKVVKRRFIQVVSLLMAFALTVSLTESFGKSSFDKGAYNSSAQAQKITEVTDKFNLDELREQYINKDLFSVNPYADDVDRWVIVELGAESVIDAYKESNSTAEFSDFLNSYIGKNVAADIQVTHRRFLGALNKAGIEYEYKYSYTALTNAVAVKVKNKDINKLGRINGVLGVHYSESYAQPKVEAVTNNANVYATGIYDTSELKDEPYGYQGQGMVVAILDTGLDFSHPAFSVMPEDKNLIWTKQQVAEKFASSKAKEITPSVTVDQVYYNEKVPFAYDYADDDPDVFPSNSAHGTHVAGIVAGNDKTKAIDASGKTFIGVAPEAQIVAMKVFTDDPESKMLGGADETDILAAVDDCARLGVDVINMSLGSSAGFSMEEDEEYLNKVYGAVEDAGISLVVAASNDYSSGYGGGWGTNLATNPDSATVGAPSTYSAALSVASIEGQKAPYFTANTDKNGDGGSVAFISNASDGKSKDLDFVAQMYEMAESKGIAKNADGSVSFNYVLVGGVGGSINYNSTVKRALNDGKTVALVKRGDITFAEKVQNAMAAGAAAVVIYNNLSGTIRMSVGDINNPVPVCSIGMDDGKLMEDFARNNGGTGTITISDEYLAGPFMSDFSSWGPTPDLKMKPEITAHGGKIISAVPGGYDEYSGTSMACPNMAGAMAILRQYVETQMDLSGKDLSARVNQLLMSTATPALNEEGNEYSPRKQGAGLAGIKDAIDTKVFLTVKDKAGNELDKTKLELGEDKNKTGEYVMTFTVNNMSGTARTFNIRPIVMTETLASDLKTVAEKAYLLNDCDITVEIDGTASTDGRVTVPAASGDEYGKTEITVTVKLGSAGRKYIEDSFKNGMFVEGFIRLIATESADVNLTIPFMAFYGDWTAAPMFDYSYYEIEESANDSSVKEEDKLKASAGASMPLALYDDGKYIVQLGTYLYSMSADDTAIVASDEHAAISIFDEEGKRTLYELTMVYAGLLRGAKELLVEIRDDITGELVYSDLKKNVRKSLANNGSNMGSPVDIGLNPREWGLNNNRSYVVTMKAKLDYKDGDGNYIEGNKNEFSFKFAVDTQAPVVKDYRIRFEPYTENKETKYRIYMDVDVYDNQYAAVLLPCYVRNGYLTLFTQNPVPIYSQKGGTTTVSFDFTDYYDYALGNDIYLAVEDFAMNQSIFKVDCSSAIEYPDKIIVATDDKLTFESTEGTGVNAFDKYYLEIQPNEVYKLKMTSEPDGTAPTKLDVRSSKTRIVQVKENEIFGVAGGESTVTINAGGKKKVQIDVVVKGKAKSAPLPNKVAIEAATDSTGKLVSFNSAAIPVIELNPNEIIRLKPSLDPWYVTQPKIGDFEFSSNNENVVKVSADGTVTGVGKGEAFVYVTPTAYPRLRKSIRVYVNEEFDIQSFSLKHYYGGPNVVFPEDTNVIYIDEDAFKNNKIIETVIIPGEVTAIPDNAFAGCTNLREITIPSKCVTIGKDAFSGCKSLEKIILLKYEDKVDSKESDGTITVGLRAFRGCSSLNEIVHAKRITTAHTGAFENCTSLESIDLSGLRVAGSNVFKGCTKLKTVITDKNTYIGTSMFENCTSLVAFEIKGSRINDSAFKGCTSLSNVTFGTDSELYYLGDNAFEGTAVASIKLPRTAQGSYCTLGANAFKDCTKLTTVTLSAGTRIDKSKTSPFGGCTSFTAFALDGDSETYSVNDGLLLSKDGSTLEFVPVGKATVSLPSGVTKIADGAFNGTTLSDIDLGSVIEIGKYAFAGTKLTEVTIPAGITTIPDGAFYGCDELTSVTFKGTVTEIGNYAFGGTTELTSITTELSDINLIGVEKIGASAFVNSGLSGALDVNSITSVGASAFAGTKLASVNLPALESVGAYAFGGITTLTDATLGGVTYMGGTARVSGNVVYNATGVFFGCSALESVTFGEGTTEVGAAAFAGLKTLTAVTFNNGNIKIGDAAFFGCTSLVNIDLGKATEVGQLSFYGNTALVNPNLTKLKKIGFGAFGGCSKIVSVTLGTELSEDETTEIAANAFADSALTSVTFGNVSKIGDYAFSGTKLVNVTIPASLNELTFDDVWQEYNNGGHLVDVTGKKTNRLGVGVFSGIETLKGFEVADGNEVFFTDEVGALYSIAADGYTLEQFPTVKSLATYTVKEGTVRIADYAFEQARGIDTVVFPYTLKSVGNAAFFGCSAYNYVFEAVEAPVLEAAYVDPSIVGSTLRYAFSDENNPVTVPHTSSVYYANFYDYVAYIVDAKYLAYKFGYYTAPDFKLTMTHPVNGTGYDSTIWKAFFSTEKTSDYAADRTTRAAIAGIDGIKDLSVDSIMSGSGSNQEKLAAIKAMSTDSVAPVRARFNLVQDPAQIALVTNADKLLNLEKAIRDARGTLGDPVALTELTLTSYPTKVRYVDGETFDPTGMVITAVYADTSRLTVTDYTVDVSVITLDTEKVVVSYGGKTIDLYLNVEAKPEGGDNPNPGSDGGCGCSGTNASAMIGLMTLIAAAMSLLILKKH